MNTPWPGVSVVMPVLNERDHLADSVGRILDQDYPGELDVVLAIGPSRDGSREIADGLSRRDSRVRVVENPSGATPAGLNAAIRGSHHPVVVRVDGHGLLPPGYIRRAVKELLDSGADNVGGIMAPKGQTPFERAVAWAMSSRWGIGDARFHLGGQAGEVDTVYLGTFRREVLEKLGGFDETFVRAQDWELNHRIRSAGGRVWFTPDLVVTYRPRSSFRALSRQFFTSGRWRFQVMHRYPSTINLRYLAPPILVTILAVSVLLIAAGLATGSAWWPICTAAPLAYGLGVLMVSTVAAARLPGAAVRRLPMVLVTMHLSWGAGFLRAALGAGPKQHGRLPATRTIAPGKRRRDD